MKHPDILVVGAGPAGLCAANAAASLGARVLICERYEALGGQLVKQTHKFFGSERQYAGTRGFKIADILLQDLEHNPNIEIWKNTAVLGVYEDGVVTAEHNDIHTKIKPGRVIIAAGAAEKFLAFPGNDLPGVCGAGAIQTLMNVYGVKPAERVLMVGAGNIGLIVAYQLLQAGVEVAAVIEAAPTIGGYLVHASKIRRSGVPILTRHTIVRATGDQSVEGAEICELDESWSPVPGTTKRIDCDTICLAVGLSPLCELCWQADCAMAYIPELSGHVPLVDEKTLVSSNPWVYVAGDASGIEEASSAMVEGRLAGYAAAGSLGFKPEEAEELCAKAAAELHELRSGPVGKKICAGLAKMSKKREVIA